MRYLLPLLAACSSGWTQKTATPEPDSRTEYTTDATETDAAPTLPARQPCAGQPHATKAGMTLAVANATKSDIDLCLWTDQSLGRVANSGGLAGFELDVTLRSLRVTGVRITCHVLVAARSPTAVVGAYEQTVNVRSSSARAADLAITKRDCARANIEDLVRQRAVPAIQRHAFASSPSASP